MSFTIFYYFYFILHFVTSLNVFEQLFRQMITRRDIVYHGESRFPHGILKSCFLCFCTIGSHECSFLSIISKNNNGMIIFDTVIFVILT